ncbi:MAG: hypothetical protein PHE24_05720 [Patescibacteria group bacterium]|nr:hypothetical protein [Patescibacteria group bacterium]
MEKDDIVITIKIPGLNKSILRSFAGWIKAKKWWLAVLVILEVLIFWKLGISAGLLWLVFISFLFFEWDARIVAFFALVSLACCPFLLIFKNETLAEQMAVYAYYFLIMTVVLQIVEYWSNPKQVAGEENDD